MLGLGNAASGSDNRRRSGSGTGSRSRSGNALDTEPAHASGTGAVEAMGSTQWRRKLCTRPRPVWPVRAAQRQRRPERQRPVAESRRPASARGRPRRRWDSWPSEPGCTAAQTTCDGTRWERCDGRRSGWWGIARSARTGKSTAPTGTECWAQSAAPRAPPEARRRRCRPPRGIAESAAFVAYPPGSRGRRRTPRTAADGW